MADPALGDVRRSRGRPREFDLDEAIDRALLLFRERGFHATSLNDLSAAMQLTPGSIYKAFDDKRSIFLAALDRYTARRDARSKQLVEAESTGFDKLRALLDFYADAAHNDEGRRGCLVVGGVVELATLDPDMSVRVKAAFKRVEQSLLALVQLGQADGSVSSSVDAKATARTLLCVLQGMRLIGKTGRTRAEMRGVATQALRLLA